MNKLYEEYKLFPQWVGWTLIVMLSGSIIAWCMALHMGIHDHDRERQWNFGAHEHVPAASVATSAPSPPSPTVKLPPPQVTPLPEGEPWDKDAYQKRSVILEYDT